jgi:GNAT superfamily N-acetyltransferase
MAWPSCRGVSGLTDEKGGGEGAYEEACPGDDAGGEGDEAEGQDDAVDGAIAVLDVLPDTKGHGLGGVAGEEALVAGCVEWQILEVVVATKLLAALFSVAGERGDGVAAT